MALLGVNLPARIASANNILPATWVRLLRSERGGLGPRRAVAGGMGAGAPGGGPGNGRRPGCVPAGRGLTRKEPHPCHIVVVAGTGAGEEWDRWGWRRRWGAAGRNLAA